MTIDASEFNTGLEALADRTTFLRTRQNTLRTDVDGLLAKVRHVFETGVEPQQTVGENSAFPLVSPYASAGGIELSANNYNIVLPEAGLYLVTASVSVYGSNNYQVTIDFDGTREPIIPLATKPYAPSDPQVGSLSTIAVITSLAQTISIRNRTTGAGAALTTNFGVDESRVAVAYLGPLS